MVNPPTPAHRELLLDRLSLLHDRQHVGVVVRLQQSQTLTVVEFPVEINRFDRYAEVLNNREELYENVAVTDDLGNGSGAMISSAMSFASDAERYLSGSLKTSRNRYYLPINSSNESGCFRKPGSAEILSHTVQLILIIFN